MHIRRAHPARTYLMNFPARPKGGSHRATGLKPKASGGRL